MLPLAMVYVVGAVVLVGCRLSVVSCQLSGFAAMPPMTAEQKT